MLLFAWRERRTTLLRYAETSVLHAFRPLARMRPPLVYISWPGLHHGWTGGGVLQQLLQMQGARGTSWLLGRGGRQPASSF